MEFRLLGPVGVWDSGDSVRLGGRRERTMLALLLLAEGRVVPAHRMVDAVWGDRPPATARRQVHSAMSTLRRVLGTRLVTRDPGYQLTVEHGELDLASFETLVGQSRADAAAGRMEAAADALRAALWLWRGPALCGVVSLVGEATMLAERRLAVLAERVDLDLRLGRHADLVAELAGLVTDHPHVERFRAQLMLALYRSGRRAGALEVFRDARRMLADDLGLEPHGELRRLERAILAADPRLDLPRPSAAAPVAKPAVAGPAVAGPAVRQPVVGGPVVGGPVAGELAGTSAAAPAVREPVVGKPAPCLLPADIADFTGRAGHIDALCTTLTGGDGLAVPVSAVVGQGGIGKTALAVHVAHRLRSVFTAGQLYVDLHGAGAAPADPAEVLARFLRAMDVDGAAIPAGLDERAELYRERLAGRRVLVLLDNARDEAQVAALLPGSPSCGVLVTSRATLGALPGARLVELDVLEPEQSLRLLGRIVGAERLAGEADAATELVRLCGGLPLAVRIAGAKLATRPHWRLADLVRRLADERQRLDELCYGRLAVRASLALSYQGLDQEARRLFRHLGSLSAPEFGVWICAAVLDCPVALAEEAAERLVEARLLQVLGVRGVPDGAAPRRYRFHDLVRAYARERSEADDGADDRAAAQRRALGAWLALVERAHRSIYGGDDVIVHGAAVRWLPDEPVLTDPLGWFETERPALVAAVRQAADLGLDEYAWDLAQSCLALFATRWHRDDWRSTLRYAMAAVRRAGNRRGEAATLYGFGAWHDAHGRYQHALRCFQRAVALYDGVADDRGRGLARTYVSHIARRLGRFELALASAEQGRVLTRAVGDRAGEASALRSVAQTQLALGNLDLVEAPLAEALAIVTATGNRRDQAQVLRELGELRLRLGAPDAAEPAFGRVLAIVRELGDRIGESFALHGIGLCLARRGCFEPAEATLAEALRLARESCTRPVEGRILMALGELAGSRQRPVEAVSWLREAAELWRRLESPLWLARTLQRLGAVHHDAGDLGSAVAAWRPALQLFRELGAADEADQVIRLLAAAGATAPIGRAPCVRPVLHG